MTTTLTAAPTPAPMLTAAVGDLVPAIKTVARQCAKRPGHQGDGSAAVQFDATDGQLTLRQYNGEAMSEVTLPVTTDDTFTFAVDGHSFTTALTKLTGRLTSDTKAATLPVSRREEGGKEMVRIDFDDIELTIPTAEWWTSMPEMPLRATLGEIPASALREGWNKVKVALLNDPALPVLGAVNLRVHGDKAVLTASDRYRIAQYFTDFTDTGFAVHRAEVAAAARAAEEKGEKDNTFNPGDGMNIPAATLKTLVPMLPKDNTPVSLSLHADPYSVFLRFTFNDACVSTKLIDRGFPDVSGVFPSTINQRAGFDKKTLVDRLTKLADQVGAAGLVEITPEGATATLRAGFDRESATEITTTLPMQATEVVAPVQRFALGRLIDAVKTVDGTEVTLAANVDPDKVASSHMVQVFPGDTEFEADSGTVTCPRVDFRHLIISAPIPD